MTAPFPVVRARLERALAGRDLAAVRAAARELPGVVTLADALVVLLLMLEVDDPALDRAVVGRVSRCDARRDRGGVGGARGLARGRRPRDVGRACRAAPAAMSRRGRRAVRSGYGAGKEVGPNGTVAPRPSVGAPRARLRPSEGRNSALSRQWSIRVAVQQRVTTSGGRERWCATSDAGCAVGRPLPCWRRNRTAPARDSGHARTRMLLA
jgi:hypothetical protein